MTLPAFAFWLFLAIVQGERAVGSAWGSRESCEEARIETMADPMVLAVSACVELTVVPIKRET